MNNVKAEVTVIVIAKSIVGQQVTDKLDYRTYYNHTMTNPSYSVGVPSLAVSGHLQSTALHMVTKAVL